MFRMNGFAPRLRSLTRAAFTLVTLANAMAFGQNGTLQARIDPPEAAAAGAQWRAGTGSWHVGGATESLAPGQYVVTFKYTIGWGRPLMQLVTVTQNQTTQITGTYTSAGSVTAWGDNQSGQCDIPTPNSSFVSVSAGYAHSLGLKSDGTVVAWGDNSAVQCDIPSTCTGLVAVSAGYSHNLGLKADGSIVAWGSNYWGESTNPSPNQNFVDIAAGYYYSLGLKANGTVVGWGWGLVDSPTTFTGVVAAGLGLLHGVGLKADGTLFAWGGDYTDSTLLALPTPSFGFSNVDAGGAHNVAMKPDGSVVAWGDNSSGQCSVPSSPLPVVAASAGEAHSLALRSDGSVVAWGDNTLGQTNLPPLNLDFVTISAGGTHNLGIRVLVGSPPAAPVPQSPTNGATGIPLSATLSVSAFSDPDQDTHLSTQWQIDDQSNFASPAWDSGENSPPVTSTTVPAGSLTGNKLYYWRARVRDHHGNWSAWSTPWSFTTRTPQNGSVLVNVGPSPVSAAGGRWRIGIGSWRYSGDAVTLTPGQYHINFKPIVGWGTPPAQMVTVYDGETPVLNANYPAPAPIVIWTSSHNSVTDIPAPNTNYTSVAAGLWHGLAIRSNGSIEAWGVCLSGECNVPSPNTGFLGVATGEAGTVAVKSDGSVVSWGDSFDNDLLPWPNSGFIAVAMGYGHGLGLKSDGSIRGWGMNGYHQCDVPSPNSNFVAVAGGMDFSLGLKTNGSIVYWGEDYGMGVAQLPSHNSGFVAVAAGLTHALALQADGSIVAWGDNSKGECNVPSPNADFVAISAGRQASAGLKRDGTIVAWGDREAGTLKLPSPNAGFAAISVGTYLSMALKQNFPPSTPTLQSPTDGTTDLSLTPTLTASPYSDPEGNTHANTQWQVDNNSDFSSPEWNSGESHSADIQTTVVNGRLSNAATYYWRVRYRDQYGNWSDWSTPWHFTTAPAPAGNVRVTIQPSEAITAGAQWRVGTGPWRDSGQTESLAPGQYIVSYKDVMGWITPRQELVTVTNGGDKVLTGTYDPPGVLVGWGTDGAGNLKLPSPNDGFVAIAVMNERSLALKSDGSIIVWGINSELVNPIPQPNTGYRRIAAGIAHGLAVRADGSIAAWGDNQYGQCNIPTTNTGYVNLAAGVLHSVGLKSDGSVVAWGYNGNGQCNVPSPNADFVAVSAGLSHTIGLKTNGTIVVWGSYPPGIRNVPMPNENFVAIASGMHHALALRADGSIATWGNNDYGQCNVPTPNQGFTRIGTFENASVAIKSDGSIYMWGDVSPGQAALPNPNVNYFAVDGCAEFALGLRRNHPPATPTPQSPSNGATDASTTLTLKASAFSDPDGDAQGGSQWQVATSDTNFANPVWDSGADYPAKTEAPVPAAKLAYKSTYYWRVRYKDNLGTWSDWSSAWRFTTRSTPTGSLSVSFSPTHAVSSGAMFRVGAGPWISGDRLGDLPVGQYLISYKSIPGYVTPGTHKVTISENVTTVDSVRYGDPGAIVAWGGNGSGQCSVPDPAIDTTAVAAGSGHSISLRMDGSIRAWGTNEYGQATAPAANSGFVTIAAGAYHNLALKADGSLCAWGRNDNRQASVPVENKDFVAVAAGYSHSLGLKLNGSVVAWGDNTYGQSSVPSPNSGFIAIAAGDHHSLGLKEDGSIVAWGRNSSGQCSVPSGNSDYVAIAAGSTHSLGLKSSGSIVAWGSNAKGQRTIPAPNTGFARIAAGGSLSLGLKAAGPLAAWGDASNAMTTAPVASVPFLGIATGGGHCLSIRVEHAPTPPSLLTPPQDATGLSLTPTLSATAYSDPEADSHADTQWQVDNNSDFSSPAWDSGQTATAATQASVPSFRLSSKTAYFWRVRYKDSLGVWSEWSSVRSFTTVAMPSGSVSVTITPNEATADGVAWRVGASPWLESGAVFSVPQGKYVVTFKSSNKWVTPPNQFVTVAEGSTAIHGARYKFPGAVVAWGHSGDGRCEVPYPDRYFSAVSAANRFSAGLRYGGVPVAWGQDASGYHQPPPPDQHYSTIMMGLDYGFCLMDNGQIRMWGGSNPGSYLSFAGPLVAAASGEGHSLVLGLDGTITGWGANSYGQSTAPSPNADFVAISAGAFYSLGLKADGTVVAWGNNSSGQCNVPAPNANFVAISAGHSHALGLKADGSVVAWGDGYHNATELPTPNTGFVAIGAGWAHNVGLKTDGTIACWGNNGTSQLNLPGPNSEFSSISAGPFHTLAIREVGRNGAAEWSLYQ